MQIIEKYFPNLTSRQHDQFAALQGLYNDWNAKINVISRKDIDNLYSHHVLHSLGIAKVIQFTPETTLLDVGTGGGFPGIPLAILFPECRFHLIDRIGKNQSGTGNSTSYRIAECYVCPLQRRRKQNQIRLHRKPSRHASGRFVETDS